MKELPIVNEIWRDVPGYEGCYQVSNTGNIRSSDRKDSIGRRVKGRTMRPGTNNSGYRTFTLHKDGLFVSTFIHRIVALAFIENPNGLPQVNHINGIKGDNRVDNLEWCNQSYNNHHASDIGLRENGEKHHNAKLTSADITQITLDNRTQETIGKIYGISQPYVGKIKRGLAWKHLQKAI